MSLIKNIVFDLGGVLIDWNPKYVYRKIFDSEEKVDWFLENICTFDWNEQQDRGKLIEESTNELIAKHPEYESEIKAYYDKWADMLGGPISRTVDLLTQIKNDKKYNLYALTNWSAETFPVALERYSFLQYFEDIIVSGTEKCKKPDVRIYKILIDRTNIIPSESIFIDDSARNIAAAKILGFQTFHFDHHDKVKELSAKLMG